MHRAGDLYHPSKAWKVTGDNGRISGSHCFCRRLLCIHRLGAGLRRLQARGSPHSCLARHRINPEVAHRLPLAPGRLHGGLHHQNHPRSGMQDRLDDCRAAKAREGLRLHGLHLFKSSTLCRRPGRYAGGSSSGPRSTALTAFLIVIKINPTDQRTIWAGFFIRSKRDCNLRSTGLPRHPEYHIAREEKIRSLPIPSFEVAYLVLSRAMSARRQKWIAETAKLKNATPSA